MELPNFPATSDVKDLSLLAAVSGSNQKLFLLGKGTEASRRKCRGFRWIDQTADVPVATFMPLPNSLVLCNSSSITMFIREPTPVERDFYIEFGLDIYNPLRSPVDVSVLITAGDDLGLQATPPLTDNFWQCTVVSANVDRNGQRIIKASKAFQSWEIVPQLENLQVRLLGPNTAAETMSAISVEFTPVTTAEDIAILFNSPAEFDFSNARTEDDEEQVIFLVEGPLIRIRLPITQGIRTQIILRNVLLGKSGGQTDISITTWTGGLFQNGAWLPGTKQDQTWLLTGLEDFGPWEFGSGFGTLQPFPKQSADERLAFRGGFRLPGKVEILYDKLENTFQRDPFTYPEQSLWSTQMGRPAYAEFHFHISVAAQVGDFLMISAAPYEPTRSIFTLVESPIGQSISSQTTVKRAIPNEDGEFANAAPGRRSFPPRTKYDTEAVVEIHPVYLTYLTYLTPSAAQITTVFGGAIHVRLLEQLVPFRRYEVVCSVVAPSAQAAENHGGAIQWFLETRDFGELPTNTNDGNSREFPIVEEYTFVVSAMRSPPLADIIVSLDVTPALAAPTSLRIISPLGFNFTEFCQGPGESAYISDCEPGQPTPSGRSTATLTVLGAPAVGLQGAARGILVRITSPTQTPVAKEWFIEGAVWRSVNSRPALEENMHRRPLRPTARLGPSSWHRRLTHAGKGGRWGAGGPVDLDTMVIYPGFTGVRSRMVWRFRTREIVQAGGYLEIRLPFGFAPECHSGSLEAISLPISGGCRVVNEALVHVFMNTTIVPHEYVFALYVTPPAVSPLFNELSIILRDPGPVHLRPTTHRGGCRAGGEHYWEDDRRFGQTTPGRQDPNGAVSDAAVAIPGARILEKLRIREGPLTWTSTKANRESTITIGFEVLESLPDLVVAPEQQIDEILITLPRGVVHLVEKLTDLQLMNENMPLRDVDYLDYFQKEGPERPLQRGPVFGYLRPVALFWSASRSSTLLKDRLRISLELNRSSWVTLKSGSYGFRFNVMVPSPLPTFNVWFVSLCSPNYPEGCSQITDPAVMATFAMPGFNLGDEPNGLSLTNSAVSKDASATVLCLLLLILSSSNR
eukprot:g15510.t1